MDTHDDEDAVFRRRRRRVSRTAAVTLSRSLVAGLESNGPARGAVDVEGLCRGIDTELVQRLSQWSPIPLTYAGGANSISDLETVTRIGQGKVHLTIGSALDIFGGNGVRYEDAVAFNRAGQA